jgi:peptide/nickel transport system substrate-binding protein
MPSPSPLPPTPTASPLGTADNPIILAGDYLATDDKGRADWESWAQRLSAASGLSVVVRAQILQPSALVTEKQRLEALNSGAIHLAGVSALAYLAGRAQGWVEPGPVRETSGQLATAIMFFARTDTGLVSGQPPQVLEQLKGRKPCYPVIDRLIFTPVSEYVVPLGLLALNGIKTGAPTFLEGLAENNYYPSLPAAVYRGECDFATGDAWDPEAFKNLLPGELSSKVSFEQWAKSMQVLYTTPPIIPQGMMAFSARLPAPLRERLSHALVETTPLQWVKAECRYRPFADVESLYKEYARIVEAAGLDIPALLDQAAQAAKARAQPTPAETTWVAPPADTLVIDVDLEGGTPFPPFTELSGHGLNGLMLPAIYAELVRLDATGNYIPYLAASLPTLENGLVRFVGRGEDEQLAVEFRLRPGLRWQDGQPLTADDLVFSWNLVMDANWPGTHWGSVHLAPEVYVDAVEAPAPDRVVYRFMSQRQAREAARSGGRLGSAKWYADLANQVGPVVPLDYLEVGRNVLPKHLLADIPVTRILSSDFARRPVYAGAYRLVEGGESGQPAVLEAFDGFALGQPKIKRLVLGAGYYSTGVAPGGQPPDKLAEGLKSGAIQAQLGVEWIKSRLGEDPHGYDENIPTDLATVAWVPRVGWESLDFNLDNPHLADRRVRQAIAYAIDRQAIIDQVHGGHATLMQSYLPAWHPLYAGDAALPDYAYDPDRARALLREAGYDLSQTPAVHPTRGPLRLRLDSMDVAPWTRPPTAALIQKQLAAVGIEVEVKFHPWKEFEGVDCTAVRNGRQFDLGMAGIVFSALRWPVDYVAATTASESIPTPENGCPIEKSNWPGWRNAQADAILAQLQDGRLALEQPDRYRQLWAEHQRLWANDLPSLPLFDVQRPVTAAPQLVGVQASPFAFGGGVGDTWNVWTWEWKR